MQRHISAWFGFISVLSPDVIISACFQIFHDGRQRKASPVLTKGIWIPHNTQCTGIWKLSLLLPDAHWEQNEASLTSRGVRRCNLLEPGACCLCFSFHLPGNEDSVISKLELWLWLSDLPLPVGHIKEKGRGSLMQIASPLRQGHL